LSQHCRAHGDDQAWCAEVNVDENGRIICIPVQCARPSPPAKGDGLLPAPCVAITHRIVGKGTDAVTGVLIVGASVTITDSSGAVQQFVTGPSGLQLPSTLTRARMTATLSTEWDCCSLDIVLADESKAVGAIVRQ